MSRSSIGKSGERLAEACLVQNGYSIITCNWRYGRYGELDIIAYHPDKRVLAFVEVKTRLQTQYGHPLEAVTPRKQANIRKIAEAYLAAHPPSTETQQISFDVIGVTGSSPDQITHYPNAF